METRREIIHIHHSRFLRAHLVNSRKIVTFKGKWKERTETHLSLTVLTRAFQFKQESFLFINNFVATVIVLSFSNHCNDAVL